MQFGIFDHLDRSGRPLAEFYEDRLRLTELYDRAGFYAYHLAEHHSTPLGMAPAPSVFLSAVAQRTKRLRLGPLIYILPLYHPLRLIEEICMLDQLSGGRLELGVGRGISPFELKHFGLDPPESQARYAEALDLILGALNKREVSFAGKYYTLDKVPIEMETVQRPHPPLWYGAIVPDSAVWLAKNRINMISHVDAASMRKITDRYRAEYAASGGDPAALPRLGLGRHIVIAETRGEALDIARRAYARWHDSFTALWRRYGAVPTSVSYPPGFDALAATGVGVAGTPRDVRDALLDQQAASGINYQLCRFAFGDLAYDESARSLRLFAEHVMPAAGKAAAERAAAARAA